MSHTVRLRSSMQYQSRPPPVTSYCHCSISAPLTVRLPRLPFSGCCRSVRWRGSVVSFSQAVRALAGAAAQTLSQPFAASLVPYRRSQPSFAGGGATRSRRFDKSGPGSGDWLSRRLDRAPKASGELRIGMDLCGRPPLANQLAQGLVVVERSCSHDNP